jgi:hypothetical protein
MLGGHGSSPIRIKLPKLLEGLAIEDDAKESVGETEMVTAALKDFFLGVLQELLEMGCFLRAREWWVPPFSLRFLRYEKAHCWRPP